MKNHVWSSNISALRQRLRAFVDVQERDFGLWSEDEQCQIGNLLREVEAALTTLQQENDIRALREQK